MREITITIAMYSKCLRSKLHDSKILLSSLGKNINTKNFLFEPALQPHRFGLSCQRQKENLTASLKANIKGLEERMHWACLKRVAVRVRKKNLGMGTQISPVVTLPWPAIPRDLDFLSKLSLNTGVTTQILNTQQSVCPK